MPNGKAWPLISIVTPSFNQGQFFEETLRSVLLQGYPNLEYIVIDGGSTDESVALIKKYEPWLTYWVSERDRGQSDAINKGLSRCTGEIFNWINSDDLLVPGALAKIASAFEGADAVGGIVINFWDDGSNEYPVANTNLTSVNMASGDHGGVVFHQPGFWFRPQFIADCGGINEQYHYIFDTDMVIRYLYFHPDVAYLDAPLVRFRLHESSKTVSSWQSFEDERIRFLNKLRHNPKFARFHREFNYHYRLARWWNVMRAATAQPRKPRLAQAWRLIRLACNDPMIRWSRKTLGCLRRVLLARP